MFLGVVGVIILSARGMEGRSVAVIGWICSTVI